MREKEVEQYLRERVKMFGGKAYKFISPGNTGVPDRLVLFPAGRVAFIELKAPGKKPSPLQLMQQRKIRDLGFEVLVIDNKTDVDKFIQEYMGMKQK